jgi:hypothetical protein
MFVAHALRPQITDVILATKTGVDAVVISRNTDRVANSCSLRRRRQMSSLCLEDGWVRCRIGRGIVEQIRIRGVRRYRRVMVEQGLRRKGWELAWVLEMMGRGLEDDFTNKLDHCRVRNGIVYIVVNYPSKRMSKTGEASTHLFR